MNDDDATELEKLKAMSSNPVNSQIDEAFKSGIKVQAKPEIQSATHSPPPPVPGPGELALGEIEELDLDFGSESDDVPPIETPLESGLDLSLDEGAELQLSEANNESNNDELNDSQYGELSLDSAEEVVEEDEDVTVGSLVSAESDEEVIENLGELSFDDLGSNDSLDSSSDLGEANLDFGEVQDSSIEDDLNVLNLSDDDNFDLVSLEDSKVKDINDISLNQKQSLDKDGSIDSPPDIGMDLDAINDDEMLFGDKGDGGDFSEDAMKKLQEIDEILVVDASKVNIKNELKVNNDEDLNESLVSEDINLEGINFGTDEEPQKQQATEDIQEVKEEKPKKKKKETTEPKESKEDRPLGQDLREISGAYSIEMERMQATISNLRGDREELLAKIQKLEEDKLIQSRNGLSLRAELDERKIELTIIRKKLNEEINELKDRLKLFEEKRLIMEEKNKILLQELDKSAQKNKIDVKKVQMRERELEQKLELLKSDAETQIRHRDLKILELKRKIDGMEFDMESISQQEKRSVESRFELEDKLEKAIKTLRSAITVLEDETDRTNALNALKKNIDM
jgi:hypothetical protein